MSFILDLLFPKKCVGCNKPDTFFCSDCIFNILQKELVCPECERISMGGYTHSVCRKRFGLDGLWSLGIYKSPLKEAIKGLKYGRVRGLAEYLADVVTQYWIEYQPLIFDQIKKEKEKWAVTAVPLHWWRENNRGFNQSSLIGQMLSRKLGLSYCDSLKRIRQTKPQAELKSYNRHQNIKDAFVFVNHQQQEFNNVLLIDDVWTTGSTMQECCAALKRNGAKQVWAITLAR